MKSLLAAFLALGVVASSFGNEKSIYMTVARDVAPGPKVRLVVNTKNLPFLHFRMYRTDARFWLLRRDKYEYESDENGAVTHHRKPTPEGPATQSWNQSLESRGTRRVLEQEDNYYDRQINLPPVRPGVYLIEATAEGASAWCVANVTNLSVVVKRSPHKLLAWVTDFRTGSLVPGARVEVYDQRSRRAHSAVTGHDGACLIDTKPGQGPVLVFRGDDCAGLNSDAPDPDGQFRGHIQTDRPIYRPGQKVSFKAILRRTLGTGYKVMANKDVTAVFKDPKSFPVERKTLRANQMGTVASDFEIPSEGLTGQYTIAILYGKEPLLYASVSCAAYRKPEFQVEVKPLRKRYLAGEDATFQVDANYYFGAAVPQAEVRYTIRRAGMGFWGSDGYDSYYSQGDGNLYPRDTYRANAVVASDVAHTDDHGRLAITFPTGEEADDSNYSISLTVTDASSRQVQATGSVPVYRSSIRLGLRSPVSYVPLGRLFPFEIKATDLDGNPRGALVTIEVSHEGWDSTSGRWVFRAIETTKVKVGANGVVRINLPSRAGGYLQVKAYARDETGRLALAKMGMYVADPAAEPDQERKQPQISVRLDKKGYSIGEQVSAFAQTNQPHKPMLMVLEGSEIWSYVVSPKGKSSMSWSQTLSRQMSPNAYVSVCQWSPNYLLQNTDTVPLPDPAHEVKVAITPDKDEYRPGDMATYSVRTTDAAGKPVSAELALGIVDEAIYALQPDNTGDIHDRYWGLRPNEVQTSESMPSEVSGGAYQNVPSNNPVAVRQRFEDTAYWNAFVTTSGNGDAKVQFEVPGNLTQWRATGRAITLSTAAGTGRCRVVATRPVTLRLATPRQLVQGDRLTLKGTVNNRTAQDREFRVALEGTDLEIEGKLVQTLTVKAKSEGHASWTLHANSLPERPAQLSAKVVDVADPSNPDLADALRVTVPVVPPGIQEQVATAGVVTRNKYVHLEMPYDKLEPASKLRFRIWSGVDPLLDESARQVLESYRYCASIAAHQLAVARYRPASKLDVRNALARVEADMAGNGWGWWREAKAEPNVTADVVYSLAIAHRNGLEFPELSREAGEAAKSQFARTNLWEYRALLASGAVMLDPKDTQMLDEVIERGKFMSPYASLRIAEALEATGKHSEASDVANRVKSLISDGATGAYLPVGYGIGWRETSVETTAQALKVFSELKVEKGLCARMAQWLSTEGAGWHSSDENLAIVLGLAAFRGNNPSAQKLGSVEVLLNGTPVQGQPDKLGQAIIGELPRSSLKPGANSVTITRSEDGAAFYSITGTVFRSVFDENHAGMRVVRRFEVQNAGNAWEEVTGPVRQNQPVRVTVTVWGDSVRDGVRVYEPIPAGFEFVSGEWTTWAFEDIRDGAVIHSIVSEGTPVYFRYFIRAESAGVLKALPATAEVIRRPTVRGRSQGIDLEVAQR